MSFPDRRYEFQGALCLDIWDSSPAMDWHKCLGAYHSKYWGTGLHMV